MLVVSDLQIDPRVQREARALAGAGFEVFVICPSPSPTGAPPRIDWGDGVRIVHTSFESGQYVGKRPGFVGPRFFEEAMSAIKGLRPLAIHAHDLNTGYVGLAMARETGAHLVADFHEWTSENVHWDSASQSWQPYPRDWKAELQSLEAQLMREASAVITVSQSIIDDLAYGLGAGRRATLIRNLPAINAVPTRSYKPLREELGIAADRFLLLYQGGTGPTRLLEPIIEALAHAPNCVLAIRGPSLDLFGDGYRTIARRGGFEDRLVLLPPVPSQDVVAAARGADAGIYSVLGVGKNFIYALPNKIFEYAAAGLPVLAANYPEARRFVEANGIGLTFDPLDPAAIGAAINALANDPALARGFRVGAERLTSLMHQDDEWQKLVALYRDLPPRALALKPVP